MARPPGHHSGTQLGPKGFCLLNTACISLNYLINTLNMNTRAKTIIDFWFIKTSSEKRLKKDEALDLEIKNNSSCALIIRRVSND